MAIEHFDKHVDRLTTPFQSGLPAQTSAADGLFGAYLIGHDSEASVAGMVAPAADTRHGGWWGPLIDLALGRAAITRSAEGQTCVTVDLRVDLTGAVSASSEEVLAVGVLVSSDPTLPIAKCEVRSATGETIAYAIGRFMLVPGAKPTLLASPDAEHPAAESLAHLLRAGWDDPADQFTMTASPWEAMSNPARVVHGGVQAALLAVGMQAAATQDAGDKQARLLDLTVAYHRPVKVSAPQLTVQSILERRGGSICSMRAGLFENPGPVLATGNATFDLRDRTT